MIALGVAGLAALGLWWVARKGDDNSAREDENPDNNEDGVEDSLGDISTALGWPYWYGRGSPATAWEDGADGVDCSGFVQMALVRLGMLSAGAPDRSAAALAEISDEVPLGEERPGDMAYYPGHVMLVCGWPDQDGHAPVMGASGGHSTTKGDDPKAYVKTFSRGDYRGDFVCYMRLRSGELGVL